jgi:hypothetical protein
MQQDVATSAGSVDAELRTKFMEFDQDIITLAKISNVSSRRTEGTKLRSKHNALKLAVANFEILISKMVEKELKTFYTRKYDEYKTKLKKFDADLHEITAAKFVAKKVTFEEKKMETILGEGGPTGENFQSAKGVMQAANRAQDDIINSLKQANRIGNTIRDQQHEVLTIVAQQTEKIYQVDKELVVLNTETERAKKDVMWFFRQISRDKLCIIIVFLLLLGTCGIIFLKIYNNRQTSNNILATTTTTTTTIAPVPPLSH